MHIHRKKNNGICNYCIFEQDLRDYENMLRRAKRKNITHLYRLLSLFYYIINYWVELDPKSVEEFNMFLSPTHSCFQFFVNK